MVDALYADGAVYDRVHVPSEAAVGFFLAQAKRGGGPVLELACGTGPYVLALAQAGHDAIGLDTSSAMLDHARGKAAALGVAPRFVEADIRSFDLLERPRCVFIAGNSIWHLLTNDDVASCFERVRRHLAPGGRFIIDVFVPSAALLARPPDGRFPYVEYVDADGTQVELTCAVAYDPISQINDVTLFRRVGEGEPVRFGSLRLRMFYPQELRLFLATHGFRVEEAFGGYDGEPLTADSAKQILVCVAR